MDVTETQHRLLQLGAIRTEQKRVHRHVIARQAQDPAAWMSCGQGMAHEKSAAASRSVPILRRALRDPASLTHGWIPRPLAQPSEPAWSP